MHYQKEFVLQSLFFKREIKEDNKGRKMLEKMGWKKGDGLGHNKKGITEPIKCKGSLKHTGLGIKYILSVLMPD